jgi:signal transduction histidine kinase
MTRRRWGLVVLGLATLAWVIGAEWVSIHHGVQENHFIDAITGLSFVIAAIIALDRRPENATGWLMIVYAIIYYIPNYSNLRLPVLPLLGMIAQQVAAALLAQIVLSYPKGHLHSRLERVVVGVTYGVGIAISAVIVLTFDPRADGCSCPWEPAPIPSRAAVLTAINVGQRAGFVVVPLLAVAAWQRWRRATPAERRNLAPLWIAFIVALVVFLIDGFASPNLGDPFAYLIWELQSVLYVSLPIILVWGMLSVRLARSAVGDLMVQLEEPLLAGELRAALSRTLGDTSLQLLYPVEEQQRWVDTGGKPALLPDSRQQDAGRTVTIVEREGRPLVALIHDPALDQGLVRAAAAAAGMTLENERLQAEVRAQLKEVLDSRQRIVEAGDRERRRVERDLHDGAQQRLATLALSLTMLRDQRHSDATMAASLAKATADLKDAISELRELARGIHPAILTDEGLPAAVEALADRAAQPVHVCADVTERLPAPIEAVGYFVVSEALANVAKHARASTVTVDLSQRNGYLRVEIVDDGTGGADASHGSGLRGLHDRVSAVRGSLRVESPPAGGTRVVAEIPCQAISDRGDP